MFQKKDRPVTFLGANSAHGFVSKFSRCFCAENGDRAYIIKGGPGTGKSSLMKRMANDLEEKGIKCEYALCSSDPDSLDGLIIPDKRTVILDGTLPHAVEPKHIGICERIVPVCDCINYDMIEKNRDELLTLYKSNAALHAKTSRFISAAGELLDDSFALDCKFTDKDKVSNLAKKMFDEYPASGKTSAESVRFLSAVTPKGRVFIEDTVCCYANKIYAVEDPYGAASSVFMSTVRQLALDKGYDIITCLCPISPHRKIDHMILPELKIAFCTTNAFLKITSPNVKRIHARRFRDQSKVKLYKERLKFNTRATEELLDDAGTFLKNAKEIHDEIEKRYITATDFETVDKIYGKISAEIALR